ncbi:MAG: acyl carrier protein [Desulfuromonas sp.]|nr:MAG: acyl carrier protein [Desulfuromonas sp.]
MTEQEIIERINSSLAEEFELDPADMTPEANIYEELELDSLDTVDMVIVLEGAFDFKIREEEAIREIRTLGDIHRFVIEKKRNLDA